MPISQIGTNSINQAGDVSLCTTSGNLLVGNTNGTSKITATGVVESTTGGFKFPDGTIQTTATAVGGVSSVNTKTGAVQSVLIPGTPVTSTSGTSINFTGIPSWVERITVMLNGVSTTGTGTIWLQLGTSGGVESTGYVTTIASLSTTANTTNSSNTATAAFPFYQTTIAAADTLTAVFVLTNLTGNTWMGQGSGLQGTRTVIVAGSKTLASALTQVRITTSNGTDTFDAGTINILYE